MSKTDEVGANARKICEELYEAARFSDGYDAIDAMAERLLEINQASLKAGRGPCILVLTGKETLAEEEP
jgi:hypothetical protein